MTLFSSHVIRFSTVSLLDRGVQHDLVLGEDRFILDLLSDLLLDSCGSRHVPRQRLRIQLIPSQQYVLLPDLKYFFVLLIEHHQIKETS